MLSVSPDKNLFLELQSASHILITKAESLEDAKLIKTRKKPELVCLDYRLFPTDNLRWLQLAEPDPETKKRPFMVILTHDGNPPKAFPKLERVLFTDTVCATDPDCFLSKVLPAYSRACPEDSAVGKSPVNQIRTSSRALKLIPEETLAGISEKIQNVRKQLCLVAKHPDNVLIRGESGTGKDLAVKLLHSLSGRKGPLTVLNCAAIPATLAEAELFGYERGAFTNAAKTFPGAFEQAHKGTLFLDEIGDMPIKLQPKLLRSLESSKIRRIGSAREISIDTRVVSATHAPITKLHEVTEFRKDLLFRISTIYVYIPPLRDRREDILYLADWYLSRNLSYKAELSPQSRTLLQGYDWPGNVRQLFAALRKGIIFSDNRKSHSTTSIHIDSSMLETELDTSNRMDV